MRGALAVYVEVVRGTPVLLQLFVLYYGLSGVVRLPAFAAAVIGLVFYFLYGYRHSHVGRGVVEVPELSPDAPPSVGIGPLPGAPEPGSPEERS